MDWQRFRLQVEVVLKPSLWHRNHSADADFDSWLSDQLDASPRIELEVTPTNRRVYTVLLNGVRIWSENAPYADATHEGHFASRAIALRFRRLIAPIIAEHNRFRPPAVEVAQ